MTAPAGRRERKKQQTMDHMADTAWKMFEAEGFDNVTMEAIAERADVAKGTLYKHFPVKEALLRHRFHRDLALEMPAILKELAELPTAAERLRGFLDRSADWSISNRDHLCPYLRFRLGSMGIPYDIDSPNRSGIEQIFTGMIRAGQESGEFRREPDAATAAHYMEFLYLASLMRWLNGKDHDLHREFHTMLDFCVRGLRP